MSAKIASNHILSKQKILQNTKQFRLEQNVLKLYNRAFLFIKMSAYFDSFLTTKELQKNNII